MFSRVIFAAYAVLFLLLVPVYPVSSDIIDVNYSSIGLMKSLKTFGFHHGEGVMASDLGFDREINADFALGGNRGTNTFIGVIDGLGLAKKDHKAAKLLSDKMKEEDETDCLTTTINQVHLEIAKEYENSGACITFVEICSSPFSSNQENQNPNPPEGSLKITPHFIQETEGISGAYYGHVTQCGDTQVIIYSSNTRQVVFDSNSPQEQKTVVEEKVLNPPDLPIEERYNELSHLFIGDRNLENSSQGRPKFKPEIDIGTFIWGVRRLYAELEMKAQWPYKQLCKETLDKYCSSEHDYYQKSVNPRMRRDDVYHHLGKRDSTLTCYRNIPLTPEDIIIVLSDGIADQLTTQELITILEPQITSSAPLENIAQRISDFSDLRADTLQPGPSFNTAIPQSERDYLFYIHQGLSERLLPEGYKPQAGEPDLREESSRTYLGQFITTLQTKIGQWYGLRHSFINGNLAAQEPDHPIPEAAREAEPSEKNDFILVKKNDNRALVLFRVAGG